MPIIPFEPYRPTSLAVHTRRYPKAAATSFERGAPVIITAGLAVEAGADAALATIVGVAQHDMAITGAYGDTDCFVTPITDPETWIGFVDTSAGFGTGTSAATDIGTRYGIAKDAGSGQWYIDKADTTADRVLITALVDPAATVQGRVEFQWLRDDNAV